MYIHFDFGKTQKVHCVINYTNSLKQNSKPATNTNSITSNSHCDTSLFSRYPEISNFCKKIPSVTYESYSNLPLWVTSLKPSVLKLV